jgi:hypothetical protein
MSNISPEASPGARMVARGSLRLIRRPYPTDADGERLLVVGDHWQTGAEVVLELFDADETHYYQPGPVEKQLHADEWDVADARNAFIYDADAKDPPNRLGYTTSPDAYDHRCTVELERFACTVYPGEIERIYRKVMVRGGTGFSVGQVMRYFDFTEEDPRVVRDRYAAECAERAARKAAEASIAAQDEAFLESLTLAELEAEHKARGEVELWTNEAEARRARSSKALPLRRQAALDEAWAALQAKIPNGITLLVPAKPRIPRTDSWSIRQFGTHEAGSPAYLVHICSPLWHAKDRPINDREYQVMFDEGQGYSCHSAVVLAEWIAKGYTTTAYPSIDLRRKFYQRVGFGILDAPRATVGGKTYYIGKVRFGSEVLVLDGETMTLCRSKKVKALIEAAHQWHTGRGYILDAIAFRESMPADDARRAELPGLRDKLAWGDAEKPAFIVPVDYQIPVIPCLTVAEILATRKNEE